MKLFKFYAIAALLFLSTTSFTQILEPVKWGFNVKDLGNSMYELVFKASIDDYWHLYSQDIAMQPPATLFTFKNNENVEFMGSVEEKSKAHELFDTNFNIKIKYFEKEAIFIQKIKILTKQKVLLEGNLEFMSCDNKQCLPPTDEEFKFEFNKDI